jgi:hypothetical protein
MDRKLWKAIFLYVIRYARAASVLEVNTIAFLAC